MLRKNLILNFFWGILVFFFFFTKSTEKLFSVSKFFCGFYNIIYKNMNFFGNIGTPVKDGLMTFNSTCYYIIISPNLILVLDGIDWLTHVGHGFHPWESHRTNILFFQQVRICLLKKKFLSLYVYTLDSLTSKWTQIRKQSKRSSLE